MKNVALVDLLKETFAGWSADNATRLSAALAYYSIFSIAPLLVVFIALVGFFFGAEAAQGQISDQVSGLVGESAGESLQSAVAAVGPVHGKGIWAAAIAFGVTLFGASTVFGELKAALNSIWGVTALPGRALRNLVRDRLLSFSLVLCIGFLLLISLAVSAAVSGVSTYLAPQLPMPPFVWKGVDFCVSLAMVTVLFAMIYRILPDVALHWRDVFPGAFFAALLFSAGKSVIAWYLGSNSVASSYQAAGTLVIILLWVYYATGILFLGAEFTKAWVKRYGYGILPRSHAALVRSLKAK
jgi:membrane protein